MSVDLRFCGRERELALLDARWRLASNVDAPSPQLVVIKAERGIGKTRLALEFGRRLSRTVDAEGPEGYWPDAFEMIGRNLDVNADPLNCRYDRPAPYLWWGLRAADKGSANGVAGNAIATYDRFLVPHLVALSMRAQALRTGRALLQTWASAGADLTANALGVDAVLTIGKTIFHSARILSGSAGSLAPEAARDAAGKAPIGRVDAVLADLAAVFDPASAGYARTPGVVLIDDAQFAADDTGLVVFVERLLYAAMTGRWPLLMIVTHWRRDLSPELSVAERSFSGILRHALTGEATAGGPAAGLPGGYLTRDCLLEIDLGRDVDLSDALRERLPGLTDGQAHAILERAGGNPRLLEQTIALAHQKLSWFANRTPAGALTGPGLDALLEAALDIHAVVRERLLEAPRPVQEAVAFAATQGLRFATSLVEETAEEMLGTPCGTGLTEAEEPYSIVVGVSDRPVAEFAERLFHEVAMAMRDDLEGIPDGGMGLDAALRDALARRLADPAFDGAADIEERALTFELAANWFAPRGSGAAEPEREALALGALARLAELERGRYAYEAALAASERFAAMHAATSAGTDAVSPWALYACAEMLRAEGRTADALAILTPLVERHRQLADRLKTPESLRDLWISVYLNAGNSAARGDRNAAHSLLTEGEGMLSGLPAFLRDEAARAFANLRAFLSDPNPPSG